MLLLWLVLALAGGRVMGGIRPYAP
eukprot:COSAG03_NODE_7724_length_879_cov_1.548718_1_plen_24_part_10